MPLIIIIIINKYGPAEHSRRNPCVIFRVELAFDIHLARTGLNLYAYGQLVGNSPGFAGNNPPDFESVEQQWQPSGVITIAVADYQGINAAYAQGIQIGNQNRLHRRVDSLQCRASVVEQHPVPLAKQDG